MIELKAKGRVFELPTHYGELTLEKFLGFESHAGDLGELVSYLCDAPFKLRVEPEHFALIGYLFKPLSLDDFPPAEIFDIKRKTYGQKIEAHEALKADNTLKGLQRIVEIYYPETNVPAMRLDAVLPIYLSIVDQLTNILKVEQSTLHKAPTFEQTAAGIEEFEKLGYFSQIDDLAGGDPLKYDAILQLEYSVVYYKLLKNKISATFTERYNAILKNSQQ